MVWFVFNLLCFQVVPPHCEVYQIMIDFKKLNIHNQLKYKHFKKLDILERNSTISGAIMDSGSHRIIGELS